MAKGSTGVDPRHFLDGGMGREEAASAYLATLIEQSPEFYHQFLTLCGIPSFEVGSVEVERELRDVTVTGSDTIVIIEVKIADSSKTPGQLRNYYERVKTQYPTKRVHSVYLARTRQVGQSEVAQINYEAGEIAVAIAWSDLSPLVQRVSDFDTTFSERGLACILSVIERRHNRPGRDWSEEELLWRDVVKAVGLAVSAAQRQRRVAPFGCELWFYGPVTLVAKCTPRNDRSTSFDTITCDLEIRFRLSGVKSPELWRAKLWIDRIKSSKSWHDFQLDSVGRWFVKTQVLTDCRSGVENWLASELCKLLCEIDDEVRRVPM